MIHFDIDTLKQRLIFLEKKTLEDSFWTDNKDNSSVLREMFNIKSKIIYDSVSLPTFQPALP